MTCDHIEKLPDLWVEEEDPWTGEINGNWEYNRTRNLLDDIDIHRMRCSRCGGVEYYSSAARAYYEHAEKSPGINGLG